MLQGLRARVPALFEHLPPVRDLEADPGKRKTPKKKKPGNASQSDTVIQ